MNERGCKKENRKWDKAQKKLLKQQSEAASKARKEFTNETLTSVPENHVASSSFQSDKPLQTRREPADRGRGTPPPGGPPDDAEQRDDDQKGRPQRRAERQSSAPPGDDPDDSPDDDDDDPPDGEDEDEEEETERSPAAGREEEDKEKDEDPTIHGLP